MSGSEGPLPSLPNLFHQLIRFETELWNAIDDRLRSEFDLPLSRFEPMRVIDRRNGCRVQDIAEELIITIGGTSKLVDRIEASGYCRRTANRADRRSSVIELTESGHRVLAEAMRVFEQELDRRIGAVLPVTDIATLSVTLTTLRGAGHHLDLTSKDDA